MKFITDPELGTVITDYDAEDSEDATNVDEDEGLAVGELDYLGEDAYDGDVGSSPTAGLPVPSDITIVGQTITTAADGTKMVTVEFDVADSGGYAVEARVV